VPFALCLKNKPPGGGPSKSGMTKDLDMKPFKVLLEVAGSSIMAFLVQSFGSKA